MEWMQLTKVFGVVLQGYQFVKSKYFAPRIILTLPILKQYVNRRDPKSGTDYQWAQVVVKNDSGSVLRNCTAYLQQINCPGHSNNVSELSVAKLPLSWTNSGGATNTDLLARREDRIDLFRFNFNVGKQLEFSWDSKGRLDIALACPGTWCFEVTCIADNAKMDKIELRVSCAAADRRPVIEMLKKSSIR